MPIITLSIPEEMKKEMENFPEINWSSIARTAIKHRIIMLEKFREFAKDSIMTERDALELGRKVNASLHKRYKSKQK